MPGYAVVGTTGRAVEAPLWRRLSTATTPASVRELHLDTDAHPNAIQHRLDRWVRAGFVTRIDGTPKRYSMNDDAPRSAIPPRVDIQGKVLPRAPSARERLWRTIRVLRTFDVPTLVIAAGATRRSAEDLINCLHRAGYLRQLVRGNSQSGTWSTYRLGRNTGPRSPSIQHRKIDGRIQRFLVDGNTGERVDISPAATTLRRKAADPIADGGEG